MTFPLGKETDPLPTFGQWLHQLWNRLHVLQPLRYRVACSGDPTEGMTDVEQIPHRSAGSGNGVPVGYGELMRLEIVDLFDLAVEACVDDVPDPGCGVRTPLLRNLFLKPADESRRFNRCLQPRLWVVPTATTIRTLKQAHPGLLEVRIAFAQSDSERVFDFPIALKWRFWDLKAT
jgi:hypothetical protein